MSEMMVLTGSYGPKLERKHTTEFAILWMRRTQVRFDEGQRWC